MNQTNLPMQMNRLDSCRNCGTPITVKSKCEICHAPKTFECTGCTHWTDDPTHDCKLFLN